MVSVCLPSDALLQHLPSYLGFSYIGRGVSLHSCSSKAQLLLLTLDEGVGGCYQCTKCRLLQLAHGARPRGATPRPRSGQKPGGPHVRRAAAKRSYHTPEVRGSGRECQAATAQERPKGATLRPRSAAARRSHPALEACSGSREEQPHFQGAVAAWVQEGLEELSHVEGQERWR